MDQLPRKDLLTAQRVEVALVFHRMLGCDEAESYLRRAGVPECVIARVLAAPAGCRDCSKPGAAVFHGPDQATASSSGNALVGLAPHSA